MELDLTMIPEREQKNRYSLRDDVKKRLGELVKYSTETPSEENEVAIPFLITEVTTSDAITRLVYALTGTTFSVYEIAVDTKLGVVKKPVLRGFEGDVTEASDKVFNEVFDEVDGSTTIIYDIVKGGYEWAEIMLEEAESLRSRITTLVYEEPKIFSVKTTKLTAIVTAFNAEDAYMLVGGDNDSVVTLIGTSDADISCGTVLLLKEHIKPDDKTTDGDDAETELVDAVDSMSMVRESLMSIKK